MEISILIFASFILRVIISFHGTLMLDQNTFIAWSNILVQRGFSSFYSDWSDYLPGYLYVLWLLGKIKEFIPLPAVVLYKMPAIISDVLVGWLIYAIVRKIKNEKLALIAASLYLFNPAILANSTLWGQVDSLTSLFSLLSVYLVGTSSIFSAVSLAIGIMIKPQAVFVIPVILFITIKDKWKFSKIFTYGLIFTLVFVLGFIPFLSRGDNIFSFIFERLMATFSQYPYTSVNAFNFWGLAGFWKADKILFSVIGYIISLAVILFAAWKIWKEKRAKYYLVAVSFLVSFLFFTRMHERHLLPVFAPLLIAASSSNFLLIPYFGLSITYLANLYYSFNWISDNFREVFSSQAINFLIILNLIFFIYTLFVIFKKKTSMNRFIEVKDFSDKLPEIKISSMKTKWLLGLILGFSLITRVVWLGIPKNEYFDEVYHAFTARRILHNDPKAWEWWNTPPEGFAYEWTHPPLAKLGMVLGMKIFGENSFGWRFPQAVLGTGTVFLIYLLAKKIFKDELTGIISSAIFALDGLPLVMSRIGMNETYLLFFVLLTVYFFLKEKNFLSAVSFGLALASKWSAIWTIPIFFLICLRRKRKFNLSILWFLLLPFTIYLLTYLPMFLSGHGLDIFWGMQKQMWWYHTGLRATHAYSSSWWSWPLLFRPVWLFTEGVGNSVRNIYAMGNPVVFWFGLASVVPCFIYSYLEKNKNLAFVIFAYLIFFVPWAVSPRILFFYHYLPSIPFLAIATGFVLRRFPKLVTIYLLLATVLFIYFYPHWTGISVPLWLDNSYYWLSTWK